MANLDQEGITDLMPKLVVDLLEAIKIYKGYKTS